MDRKAWHAAIHGVAKSWTRLSDWTELTFYKWKILPLNSLHLFHSAPWNPALLYLRVCFYLFICFVIKIQHKSIIIWYVSSYVWLISLSMVPLSPSMLCQVARFNTFYVGERNGTPLQYSCLENPMDGGAWWAAVHGVAKSRRWLSDFTFTFHFHVLEKEMATHSSVLAWRIPGTGEPGEMPSMGSHRVGHDWSDLAVAAAVWLSNVSMFLYTVSSSSS